MKTKLLMFVALLLSFALPVVSLAQVSMTLQVPAAGVLLKKQLWNMALIYTGDNPVYVRISLTLSQSSGDVPVLSAGTSPFLLSKGAKQIQAGDLGTIQYRYLSSNIADHDPDGFLPVGNYQACYTVFLNDEQNTTPLAEDCIPVEIEPLSPPVLNMPGDEDTLLTVFPQFSWLPPSPVNLFSNLSYRFNLVQIQPGQTAAEAVQQNLPLYTNQNISDNFINYPASMPALDTGKQYAWQVVAQNNMQLAAQSEVWTFRVQGGSPTQKTTATSFILLKAPGEMGGVYTAADNMVGVKYYSYEKEHYTDILFLGADKQPVKTEHVRIQYGDNYLSFNLGNSFKKGQLYYVQLTTIENTKYTAAFRIP
jgi:hypothetical protein